MPRATIARVNAALRAAGHAEELVQGRGYVYFAGGSSALWPSSSVMVCRVSQLSVAEWLREREELAAARLR